MFGLGPAYLFVRPPIAGGCDGEGSLPWFGTMVTNLAILIVSLGMIFAVGLMAFLLIHIPLVLLAASAGVWLFYVQHQFEETHWAGSGVAA